MDFPRQIAVVTVVSKQYEEAALIKALQKQGFGAKVLKEKEKK